jgi:hypothetical protein
MVRYPPGMGPHHPRVRADLRVDGLNRTAMIAALNRMTLGAVNGLKKR